MRRFPSIAMIALGVAAVAVMAGDAAPAQLTFEGRYRAPSGMPITISRLAGNAFGLVSYDWEGVGFLDGTGYWGVFRVRSLTQASDPGGASGTHRATLRPDGSLAVHVEYSRHDAGSLDEVWSPDRTSPPRPDTLPAFGGSAIEELPEAVTKVPPTYPPAAREARVDGLVLLSVLVGEDGSVKEVRVRKSIPLLDEAAQACVRQWRFKPARAKGEPVAIWIALPIRFTLH
jgi:TonB family protein